MIGVVIVTHCRLGQALVECCEHIVGEVSHVRAVAIDADDDHDVALKRIRGAVSELQPCEGVLVLTDMFGGTPSNVCLSLLEPGQVEVISGVNMPMLLHVLTNRDRGDTLQALAQQAAVSAKKNVVIAGALLDDSSDQTARES